MRRNETTSNSSSGLSSELNQSNSISVRRSSTRRDVNNESGKIYIYQDNVQEVLGGFVDPTMEFLVDSLIDLGDLEITIPEGGICLTGLTDEAGFISASDGHTMFKSEGIGSGEIKITGLDLTQTGNDSALFYLWSDDQWNDFTFQRNVMNVQSAGVAYGYDQLVVNKNLPLDERIRFVYDNGERIRISTDPIIID